MTRGRLMFTVLVAYLWCDVRNKKIMINIIINMYITYYYCVCLKRRFRIKKNNIMTLTRTENLQRFVLFSLRTRTRVVCVYV